jgi:hypothetical protein
VSVGELELSRQDVLDPHRKGETTVIEMTAEQAVHHAADSNIEVFSEQGMRPEYHLDAAQFIKDLYDAGWEIVRHG